MLGVGSLKDTIKVTDTHVECPVSGCNILVGRQRTQLRHEGEFLCREHGIWISPSTFEYSDDAFKYADDSRNLLDNSRTEIDLLRGIQAGPKTESRMARERSEDAVTWNVFRFLQNHGLLEDFFVRHRYIGIQLKAPKVEVVYWSSAVSSPGEAWSPLREARGTFGETGSRHVTEPDLVVSDEDNLVFVEAKLTATNVTPAKTDVEAKVKNHKKYDTGGDRWFRRVFKPGVSYDEVVRAQKYELLRLWLLGTWMASQRSQRFTLINLVRHGCESGIEDKFGKFIDQDQSGRRRFLRTEWEDIYRYVRSNHESRGKILLDYFENKTIGYRGSGKSRRLKPAFETGVKQTR